MEINLKNTLQQLTNEYVAELNDNIKNQKGIDNIGFQPTIEQVGKQKISRKRLYKTGELSKNAFIGKSTENTIEIIGNPATHSNSNTSYNDIVVYNDKNSPKKNSKFPSIVPWAEDEAMKTKTGQKIIPMLETEIIKQIESDLEKSLPKQITIKASL